MNHCFMGGETQSTEAWPGQKGNHPESQTESAKFQPYINSSTPKYSFMLIKSITFIHN